ncbi:DUF4038 domain-containing protein [Proteiniphilum sp.]|uniref:apiosidase-like domain-containing protein n=1 Tax=Proteiniphilum sp. TaxID=1926877 RepID=UPI002B1F8E79|nr:DUF4038 domain-containing protein [Proteiniphilum sp.]MEA4917786.1 DUF4038 domain-containing protein [Proteiniphilum sp.]
MDKKLIFIILYTLIYPLFLSGNNSKIEKWHKKEFVFESRQSYDNPLYDVDFFGAEFISPSGKKMIVRGFWDGGTTWKIRFMPDETGRWKYRTVCSDQMNNQLNGIEGNFTCVRNRSKTDIHRRGPLKHLPGTYHLTYNDDKPFLYIGCTAWNGGLISTVDEWEKYLSNRQTTGYSVIQLITTQWRGGPYNAENEKAFSGVDKIIINPSFFKRLDDRIDRINDYGLVAAPVMLWAYGDLNPGSLLPEESAIKLAEYILARYDGNHVIWTLGGDGKFTDENEERWKNIGRAVFEKNYHRNITTLHPHGFSWYGSDFNEESWLDMISYQTGHTNSDNAIRWKTQGPVVSEWKKLIPRPVIDTEPVYENGHNAKEVRNSAYWSIFSTPVAGVSYGSHTIWPWLRIGDTPINHGKKDPSPITWYDALFHEGSMQIGYLSGFFRGIEWWKLAPANELLSEQPGLKSLPRWQSVLATGDRNMILVYVPVKDKIKLRNIDARNYTAQWFDTAGNTFMKADIIGQNNGLEAHTPFDSDAIFILRKKKINLY